MSHKLSFASGIRMAVMAGMLLASSYGVLAQRGGGGGGHIGGGSAGSGGLSGGGRATGLDERDDLKDFHAALAMQATGQQIVQYNLMLKSTEAAGEELRSLVEQAAKDNAPALATRDKSFEEALATARVESKKFLEGLSDRQKSGLKETVKKLIRTDSELGQQNKELDEKFEESKIVEPQIAATAQTLDRTLNSFHTQQIGIGEEMSIAAGTGQEMRFDIPPVKTTVTLENQPVAIATSGVISRIATAGRENSFSLLWTEDMSDLQQYVAEVLRSRFNKTETCGERIAIRTAALTPLEPASTVVAGLHYERWTCRGGDAINEMVEGDGTFEVKLSLAIAADGGLRLEPSITRIEAQGLVDDLLRSGALGETLRDNIADALLPAIRAAWDVKPVLPAAAHSNFTLRRAHFQGTGMGKLSVVFEGEMQLAPEAATSLVNALKLNSATNGESKDQSSTQPSAQPAIQR